MNTNRILLAGSTGYLGEFILGELLQKGFKTKTIVRDERKLPPSLRMHGALEVLKAEMTRPEALTGCCENIDVVISTVGITRQKDGLTYMDVDYQANMNLLREALGSGAKKFIYISVLHGDQLTRLKLCEAKEKFVEALKKSGMDYCVIRPTGYFSDMAEFYDMARRGRVYLFGSGEHKMNPIHGADLAEICVNAIDSDNKEVLAGGPQILTHNQIAQTALAVAGKKSRITHIPNWIRRSVLALLRTFTSSKTYGPIEFFMTVLSMDIIAPEYGSHYLKDYYKELES